MSICALVQKPSQLAQEGDMWEGVELGMTPLHIAALRGECTVSLSKTSLRPPLRIAEQYFPQEVRVCSVCCSGLPLSPRWRSVSTWQTRRAVLHLLSQ